MSRRLSPALAALVLMFATAAGAQTVYGLFGLPSPDLGKKQLGVLDPTDGSVALVGSSGSIDADTVSVGTGITAIAVAGDVFYFIGQDAGDGTSKVYTVDLGTGATTASPALSAFSAGLTLGLWYDEATGTLWGLFSNGGDRALASVDPATGAVTVLQAAIAGENLTTAGGVFTGDPDGGRVFLVGTPDSGEPTLYEVGTSDGSVTPWPFEDYSESTVMGMEWDATLGRLWLIVFRGTGRQLAEYNFDEQAVLLAPEEIEFGDPIATSSGLTAVDDAGGQLFFIGRPNGGSWSVYTVELPDGAATAQAIDGASIQVNGWAGFEVVPGPELSVVKDDGGASVVPGDTITWTITTADAAGAGPAKGVVLTEVVPDQTTFSAGDSTAGWSCTPDATSGSTCTLDLPDIAPGADEEATFAVTVDASVSPDLTQVDNTAVASATNSTAVAKGSDSTPVTAAAVVSLTKTDGGASTTPGATVAYALTAENTGNADAVGSVLHDTVPANTVFSGTSSPGWSCADGAPAGTACTFDVGTLEGGTQVGATFAVRVVASVPAGTTAITNQASFTADNPILVPASDSTPVTSAPLLELSKTDGDVSAAPGDVVPYLLEYTNSGNQDAADAVLTETVPAESWFAPASSTAGWSCVPDTSAGSTCTLALGTVDGDSGSGSAIFAVTVVDPVLAGTTEIANQAGFSASNASPAASASDTTPVVAAPDLTLLKTDGGITTRPGRSLTWALLAGNDGNQDAAGAELTETVPAHTAFFTDNSSPGWACLPDGSAGATCTYDVGTVGGGGSELVLFAVVVEDPYTGGSADIANSASVDADNAPAPADAQDTTPVDAYLDLAVAKSDGGVTARPGGQLAYTVSWENPGTQSASGVEVTETVPAATTFDAGASSPGWSCAPDGSAGSTCLYQIASLAPGATGSAAFVVVVDDPTAATSVENTVTIADDGSLGADVSPADNSASITTTVDLLPPEVTSLDTVPSSGGLDACAQLPMVVSSLVVGLEDDLSGVVDADLLGSYMVVSAGEDGDLSTSACGPVLGDDVEVPLSGVTVTGSATSLTATLDLQHPLGNGLHRLLVCDTITDAAGNALDGNGNGEPGGDLSLPFRVDVGNLFANAHLDDCPTQPIALSPWTGDTTAPSEVLADPAVDIDGAGLSGSIQLHIIGVPPVGVSQCVDVSQGVFVVTAHVRGAAFARAPIDVSLSCAESEAPSCAELQPEVVIDSSQVLPSASPAWMRLRGVLETGASAASIRCGVVALGSKGLDDSVFVDDLALASAIFADGFESGDTSAWSFEVP